MCLVMTVYLCGVVVELLWSCCGVVVALLSETLRILFQPSHLQAVSAPSQSKNGEPLCFHPQIGAQHHHMSLNGQDKMDGE